MKRILFFVNIYWELHWLHNVIEALNADVYTENETCKEYCKRHNFNLVNDKENYQVVATMNIHFGEQWNIASHYKNTGGKVVLFQHAWDSALHLKRDFWNKDMGTFDLYLVGSTQDQKWLKETYSDKNIVLTGLPKFDDLYKVKKSKKKLDYIYKKYNVDSYLLSVAPSDSICIDISNKYEYELESSCPIPVIYKMHPGSNHQATLEGFYNKGRMNIKLIPDDEFDRFSTYEMIKASAGVACVESFLSTETSLLEKPVVFWGREKLPQDFYQRDFNINQVYRAPAEMSSSLTDLRYMPQQREIAEMYLCDGNNTKRTVNILKEFLA